MRKLDSYVDFGTSGGRRRQARGSLSDAEKQFDIKLSGGVPAPDWLRLLLGYGLIAAPGLVGLATYKKR